MSSFAIVYLFQRFLFRIADFFHHWYIDGTRAIILRFFSVVRNLDQTLALRVTLRHLFEPLYKDYSPVGKLLGPIFRIGRVVIGLVFYAVIAVAFFMVGIAWLFAPVFILIYASGLFE